MLLNQMYVVKRATFPNFTSDDATELDDDEEDDVVYDLDLEDFFPISESELESSVEEGDGNKMIETAVFLDHVGYRRLSQVTIYVTGHRT